MFQLKNVDLEVIAKATQTAKDFLPEYNFFHVNNVEYEEKEEIFELGNDVKFRNHQQLQFWTIYIECGHGKIEVDCWKERKENVLYCDVTLW
ncbi:MAG: hypothetical protein AAFX46_19395 [Cyanobacteria bacterium J06636_27]